MLGAVYDVVLVAGFLSGIAGLARLPVELRERDRRPIGSIVLALILVLSLVAQLHSPSLLSELERNRTAIGDGQWWRLATALVFQDGGLAGGAFNVIELLLVLGVAERLWGTRRLLAVALGCALPDELLALLWQPVGAGNSIVNFSVASALAVWLAAGAGPQRPDPPLLLRLARWVLPAVFALGALVLLAGHDIHGLATVCGGVAGVALVVTSRARAGQTA